ncbi:MAG: hypothetical protein Kow00109_09510 [Acidobacteriota bacterium]
MLRRVILLVGVLGILGLGRVWAQDRVAQGDAASDDVVGAALAPILESWADLPAGEVVGRLTRLAQEHPEDPRVWNFLGAAHAENGAFERAEESFRTALRLAPGMLEVYLNLGRLYLEWSPSNPTSLERAAEVYRTVLRLDPGNREALFQGAFVAYLRDDLEEAEALLHQFSPQDREHPRVRLLAAAGACRQGADPNSLAEDLVRREGWEEADLLPLIPKLREAGCDRFVARLLDHLEHLGRLSAETTVDLALLHDELGEYEKAVLLLNAVGPRHPDPYQVLLQLAWLAYRHRDFEDALGYLAHARDLRPEDPRIHLFFGLTCVELNLSVEALKSLEKALELAPENPFVQYAYGATAMHWKEPAEAIPYLERYCAARPDDARGRATLAEAYFLNKEYERARELFEGLLAMPDTAVTARFYLGVIARFEHRFEEARRHFEAVLAADPRHAGALAELGWLLMRDGRFDEAERALDRALQLDPEHYQANFNLLTLYSRTKDPRFAEQRERFERLKEKRWQEYSESLRTVEVIPPQLFPALERQGRGTP